ncbi:formyltransferase family protein [Paenibacillus endoradicis]|uniref:formyltransferase family protein n=1 Tax=Paenibacillus endoradicis TaxID=2972487 RepID=UPI002158D033|nr:formyltransferase family protein [Paenibacillus endoradicis]MCR8660535.1 methionyl-tRNA formyltransferase [Paenibacillus endoradicis]
MKVVLLTGSHPRHLHVVNQLVNTGYVVGHVIEQREEFVPQPPSGLEEQDRLNFIRHFADRDYSEQTFFAGNDFILESVPTLNVTMESLNHQATIDWVTLLDADLMISYGVHKLSDELLAAGPTDAWNIHGGLSPWYRGNTTLFWPFYNLKPNWAGMTIHKLSSRLDAGDILHHSVPKLEYGDGIHDVANRAVMQVAEDLKNILKTFDLSELKYSKQKSAGKLYVTTDWQPQHLRVVYQLFDNDIVDHFLDGKLGYLEPPLVKAFID